MVTCLHLQTYFRLWTVSRLMIMTCLENWNKLASNYYYQLSVCVFERFTVAFFSCLKAFNTFDHDKDGQLSKADLVKACKSVGFK